MRLDRFLCETTKESRSRAKEWIKRKAVLVNGQTALKPEQQINEKTDQVTLLGKPLTYQQFYYYMLNKPAGMVTAHRDALSAPVMELLKDAPGRELFPAGRLDKDAEGFLLITNDGALAHTLLSPRYHVPKTYFLKLAEPFTKKQAEELSGGVDIGEDAPCGPAEVQPLTSHTINLTIHEGKFHQVKRMLAAVGNEVLYLKRISFGGVKLDESLAPGQYRPLTAQELAQLKEASERKQINHVEK